MEKTTKIEQQPVNATPRFRYIEVKCSAYYAKRICQDFGVQYYTQTIDQISHYIHDFLHKVYGSYGDYNSDPLVYDCFVTISDTGEKLYNIVLNPTESRWLCNDYWIQVEPEADKSISDCFYAFLLRCFGTIENPLPQQ